MRKLMMGFLTTAAVLFAATSANAARWSCEGAEYVCGSSASKATQSYDDSEPKAARATKRARAAASTNDDETPVRRQKVKVAKADNDETPAPRKRARSSDNDSGGDSYSGKASYYWEPQALASGGRFNPNAMTAAHKTLPFGTRVRVTNQSNGQSVEVVINDRGPYIAGRIIDLSKAAAHAINMQGAGVASVTVRVLGRG
jgi:rare lipoprotein A